MSINVIENILKEIKKNSEKIYFSLKDISHEILQKNIDILYKILDDFENNNEPTIEIKIDQNKNILWGLKLSEQNQKLKKRREISNNYIHIEFPIEQTLFDLNTIEQNTSRKEIMSYIKSIIETYPNSKGFWLYGSFGTGKTYISISFLNYFVKNKNLNVAQISLPSIFSLLKFSFGEQDFNKNLIESLKNVDILLIDDIGSEASLLGWARDEILFVILNYRMENKLLTCFTSNYSIEAYEKNLLKKQSDKDEVLKINRLFDRIKTLSKQIELKGTNRRKTS